MTNLLVVFVQHLLLYHLISVWCFDFAKNEELGGSFYCVHEELSHLCGKQVILMRNPIFFSSLLWTFQYISRKPFFLGISSLEVANMTRFFYINRATKVSMSEGPCGICWSYAKWHYCFLPDCRSHRQCQHVGWPEQYHCWILVLPQQSDVPS